MNDRPATSPPPTVELTLRLDRSDARWLAEAAAAHGVEPADLLLAAAQVLVLDHRASQPLPMRPPLSRPRTMGGMSRP